MEAVMGVAVMGVVFVSLYAGFASGFSVVQLARENLRATQIIQEKMETIRLYTWTQVNSNGFIPTTFTAPYYAVGGQSNQGLVYSGTVKIASAPMEDTSYADNLKQVTVSLTWNSAGVQRSREMKTFVSRYGLQNYIY